jgi:hypothetical protein
VYANVALFPDLTPLVATLKANLPPLIAAAEQHGRLVLDAAGWLVQSGQTLTAEFDGVDGKSLACAAAASFSAERSVDSLNLSVHSGGRINTVTADDAL